MPKVKAISAAVLELRWLAGLQTPACLGPLPTHDIESAAKPYLGPNQIRLLCRWEAVLAAFLPKARLAAGTAPREMFLSRAPGGPNRPAGRQVEHLLALVLLYNQITSGYSRSISWSLCLGGSFSRCPPPRSRGLAWY